MSSILTNNGAMVALQTLKGINQSLGKTQSEISTGKAVGTAKDNAAVWAISKTMEADMDGFKGISDGLSQGESTVATARAAAESVTDLLKNIKSKIVSAQQASGSDRLKMQTDIEALREQIGSVVGAAQFNGVNLLNGSSTTPMNVLSSLDRDGGGVTPRHISVARQDISLVPAVAATFGATAVNDLSIIDNGGTAAGTAATLATAGTQTISIESVGSGHSYSITLDDTADANSLGSRTFSYVATAQDSAVDVATRLGDQIAQHLASTNNTNYSVLRVNDRIEFTNASGDDISVTATTATGGVPASGGGLGALNTMSVTTDSGATAALTAIEGLIQTSINAASALGSAQQRIEIQNDFVGKLSDLMKSGIGSLVDANMEEASARLQALQVQQQLATQSLSIANQAPQQLLSLFR
ncbi:flagellin [Paracoccus sp. S-4012]|uniref:flagellin n=1 Tax=Paracoccus sp. S-4012 TaxID=2665648 RepID=UPI0012AF28B7|nr:flagellin [Paracoccus sp. S-4012]MRX49019.1 flagellin [Paracoccus sp. S-4012]